MGKHGKGSILRHCYSAAFARRRRYLGSRPGQKRSFDARECSPGDVAGLCHEPSRVPKLGRSRWDGDRESTSRSCQGGYRWMSRRKPVPRHWPLAPERSVVLQLDGSLRDGTQPHPRRQPARSAMLGSRTSTGDRETIVAWCQAREGKVKTGAPSYCGAPVRDVPEADRAAAAGAVFCFSLGRRLHSDFFHLHSLIRE